jgi:hypothetical protein
VLILLIVLIVTNLVTLGVLARLLLRPVEHPSPDETLARSLHRHHRPAVSTSSTRRVITIEILNAIEVAGTRSRWAGIAGALAPGITHRVVYDHAMRIVRKQLASEKVVADVRLHVVRPDELMIEVLDEPGEPDLPEPGAPGGPGGPGDGQPGAPA